MNVIDLRDELYERKIEIISIGGGCVYYAEELNSGGEDRLYIYSYDLKEESERMLSFFTLNSPDYITHYFSCGSSIIILFENNTSNAWLIKIDRTSGAEVLRRRITLIGRYFDCVPIDENNLMLYTKADEENRTLFNRCLETTNTETIANLYDLSHGYRYFVKDFHTAELIERGVVRFVTAHGEERLLLCDPYCGESEKEELVRVLSNQLSQLGDELRDSVWVISVSRLIDAIRTGTEKIPLRRAASAGVEGTVRFESMHNGSIILRAKVYKSQLEQFFEMSASNGKISPVCTLRDKSGGEYFTDKSNGSIYFLTPTDSGIRLQGEIGSTADIEIPDRVGEIESFIDDRYVIARRQSDPHATAIYDSRLGVTDIFEARAKISGSMVVLY